MPTDDAIHALKEMITVRLTLLVGACRRPGISKKQIEESISRAITEVNEWEVPQKAQKRPRTRS